MQNGPVPVLGLRLRLTAQSGEAILPVFYSDNYLMLMPGEDRLVSAAVGGDAPEGGPVWELTGWNLRRRVIRREEV